MFCVNAPDWTAKVVKSDTISDITRVTIASGGMGPQGKPMVQHGQYFVEMEKKGERELVSRMVGFAGTGES